MNNTISQLNFNGCWQIGTKTVNRLEDGTRAILYERIYHPFVGETKGEIAKTMKELHSGWSYSIWNLHPNGGQRNKGGIFELYVPKLGTTIDKSEADRFIAHDTMLDIENVYTDSTTFANKRFNDHFRLADVAKLTKKKVSKLVSTYFKEEG